MKQNNQGSWAARLRKITALCLMLVVSAGAWADNKLTIKPDVKAGQTGTITIALDNATDYTAFQMEIKLPEGLSLYETEGQNDAMEIVSQNETVHHVQYSTPTANGVTTVVAYSFEGSRGNEAFKANGDMLVIKVTAASDYTPAEVSISDPKFVTFSDIENLVTTFTVINEQGEEVLLGDVNGDGTVNVQDILQIVDKILGVVNPSFNEVAGDLNADGTINVQDILLVVDIIITNN